MKGGKGGRKRRPGGVRAAAEADGRARAKKGPVKRTPAVAPKKGSRKKSFGPVTKEDTDA